MQAHRPTSSCCPGGKSAARGGCTALCYAGVANNTYRWHLMIANCPRQVCHPLLLYNMQAHHSTSSCCPGGRSAARGGCTALCRAGVAGPHRCPSGPGFRCWDAQRSSPLETSGSASPVQGRSRWYSKRRHTRTGLLVPDALLWHKRCFLGFKKYNFFNKYPVFLKKILPKTQL